MKKANIYIGTIKKCLDLNNYLIYGDSRYIGDYRICNTEYGYTQTYTKIVELDILLIKVGKNKFIPIYDWNNLPNIISTLLGMNKNILTTKPSINNSYFIDENTLKNFYPEEERPHRLTYKTLKSHTL